jgi:phosphatidate cytidylyltransferase
MLRCKRSALHLRAHADVPMLKRVLTAVVLVPIVLVIVFWAPGWFFAAVLAFIACLTSAEYLDLVKAYGSRPFRTPVYFFLLLSVITAGTLSSGHSGAKLLPVFFAVALLFAIAVIVVLIAAMARENLRESLPDAAFSLLALPYITLPLVAIISLRAGELGPFVVLYLLVIVWAGDIAAFFVGRSLGKNKLAPRISPNKTWEGSLASVAASIIVGGALAYGVVWYQGFFGDKAAASRVAAIAGLAAIPINIAAQLGDLVESMIKRGAGVKDSGSILPGHGGMLDRIDALLFAAPVLWYYALIAAALGPR